MIGPITVLITTCLMIGGEEQCFEEVVLVDVPFDECQRVERGIEMLQVQHLLGLGIAYPIQSVTAECIPPGDPV